MIVADTTLIAYLTIEGEFTEAALAVRAKDPLWAAPALWESEFANVLLRYVRGGVFSLEGALRRLDVGRDLLAERTFAVSASDALRLGAESGCSAYDCQYVALALQLQILLVTHDGEVPAAYPDTAIHPDDFLRA